MIPGGRCLTLQCCIPVQGPAGAPDLPHSARFVSHRPAVTAKALKTLTPDAIVMDARMPNLNGLDATRRLDEHVPKPFKLQDRAELLERPANPRTAEMTP